MEVVASQRANGQKTGMAGQTGGLNFFCAVTNSENIVSMYDVCIYVRP